ncbi:MAG: GGDEF domain-containing protein [Magnetococcales bacterium]|nr:GGDEF domain-containing protein [Magnetococcales bacterium]
MGVPVGPRSRQPPVNPVLFARYPADLLEELREYKRQSERLGRIYELHRHLAETLDMNAMIAAFSRWLMPYWSHRLLAYRHFGSKNPLTAYVCDGDAQRELLPVALDLLQAPVNGMAHGQVSGQYRLFYHLWPLSPERQESLLLLHGESMAQEGSGFKVLTEVLPDLYGPLQRTLAYEELYHQARRDALTGLVNRRVFEERLLLELSKAERYNQPLVLACLDLDHFKAINDRLGHAEGDAALQRVAQAFAGMVRDSDLLARVGGDEFAMVLPNTSLDNARQLTTRLCQRVADLNIRAPDAPPLGVSVGLACWQEGASFKQLWEQADAALYRAKAAGRSRVAH